MPPLTGSPAIDPAGGLTESEFATDQRGLPRISGGIVDIGAVEFQGGSGIGELWNTDSDNDGVALGVEQALGMNPDLADSNAAAMPTLTISPSGRTTFRFGKNPAAHPRTIWIVKRSTDLKTFEEIFRYDGNADSPAPGVAFIHGGSSISVIDTNPPGEEVFYRFEAELADP